MEILKRNWKIKLLSLAIAIFFWSFVIVLENPNVTSRIANIPIIYENINILEEKGLSITEDTKKSVDISISGQRNRIINLTPQHIRVTADFSSLEEGAQVLNLNYALPDEINLVDAPKDFSVTLEKIISTEFKVNVRNKGNLPDNYLLDSTKVTPEKVTVKGLRSTLNSINNVSAILDLSKLTQDITINQEIKAYKEDGSEVSDVTFGQDFVNINAVIMKTKEVEINPVIVGEVASNYKLEKTSLNRSKVYIVGPESIIDSIDKINTHDIDISNVRSSQKLQVSLSLPSDVSELNKDITYLLDVEIQSKTNKDFEISKDKILVTNNNIKYDIINDNIKLSLTDFPSELEKINASNIELKVDISGLDIGKHELEPIIFLNGNQIEKEKVKTVDKIGINITE